MPVGGVALLDQIKRAFRVRNPPGLNKYKGSEKGSNQGNSVGDEDPSLLPLPLPPVVLIVGDCVISEGQ